MTCTVVLGASKGIGARLADHLVDSGRVVVGVGRSDASAWEATRLSARQVGDVSDESFLRRVLSAARKENGDVDQIVNCVGAFSSDLLTTASSARASDVFLGNALIAHTVMREAARAMMRARTGSVVTMSSVASRIPMRGNALYGAAKRAAEHLTASYAQEMAAVGVRYYALGISFVDSTTMVDSLGSDLRAQYEQRLTVPRPVSIEDIASYLTFLASPAGELLNGQTLFLGSPH